MACDLLARSAVLPDVPRGQVLGGRPGQPGHQEEDAERDQADDESSRIAAISPPDDVCDHGARPPVAGEHRRPPATGAFTCLCLESVRDAAAVYFRRQRRCSRTC